MADLNERIAARRRELALQKESEAAFRKEQERQVLDTIASSLTDESVHVRVDDDELALDQVVKPTINVQDLRQSKLKKLLKREARRRWTPAQNWWVIGCIVAGVCLIHIGGLGLLPLAVGIWQLFALNKRYEAAVRSDYAQIFNTVT